MQHHQRFNEGCQRSLKTTAPLPVMARGCQRSLCLHSDPSTRQRRSCRPLTGRHEEGHGRRNLSLKVRQELHLSVKLFKQQKQTKMPRLSNGFMDGIKRFAQLNKETNPYLPPPRDLMRKSQCCISLPRKKSPPQARLARLFAPPSAQT